MVKILIAKESTPGETRVAATPETVTKLIAAGVGVVIESGAGAGACISDDAYRAAGADVTRDVAQAWASADVVLKVREPVMHAVIGRHELEMVKPESTWVSHFLPLSSLDDVKRFVERRVSCFSMNLVPRISRAQRMDALSSQSNIAGYKAVLLAAAALPKYFPLFMTAAGTTKPAKVVVMGAGVAGLQAVATARRLGAQVWATDIRSAVKEQVESLGAKFIDVPGSENMEGAGGYAKEASSEFLERQRKIVGDHVADCDVVITTALVPGRKAPLLIPAELVCRMRQGSVIVDLAAEQGGNCSETRAGETVVRDGVTILGPVNLPATVAVHASELYARNVLAFFQPLLKDGSLKLDFNDEVVAGACVTHAGEIKHAATAAAHGGGK